MFLVNLLKAKVSIPVLCMLWKDPCSSLYHCVLSKRSLQDTITFCEISHCQLLATSVSQVYIFVTAHRHSEGCKTTPLCHFEGLEMRAGLINLSWSLPVEKSTLKCRNEAINKSCFLQLGSSVMSYTGSSKEMAEGPKWSLVYPGEWSSWSW